MPGRSMTQHNCDLCNSDKSIPIPVDSVPGEELPHICQGCGFVYVKNRRSTADIAHEWDTIWGEGYTSAWPAVQARLFFVAEWFDQKYGWDNKRTLDIGAGEGDFLKMIRTRGAIVSGVEPAMENVKKLITAGIPTHRGPIESFQSTDVDVVTILWTLENCGDCIGMLERARECLGPDGRLVVATGSRLMVPFKKPLSQYLGSNAPDLHCFRFSLNTLKATMRLAGFEPEDCNFWGDSDWLVVTAARSENYRTVEAPFDKPDDVADFFRKWQECFP